MSYSTIVLGPDVFARQWGALRDRVDRQAALAEFSGSALVLMGAEDRLCPRDRHELMHALMPQSRLVVIVGVPYTPTPPSSGCRAPFEHRPEFRLQCLAQCALGQGVYHPVVARNLVAAQQLTAVQ